MMAISKKVHTGKLKEKSRKILSFVLVVIIVAILMSFDMVAKPFADLIGTTPEKVKEVAGSVIIIGVAVALLFAASMTMAIPFVGVAFAVIGGAMLVYEAWRIFSPKLFSE